MTRIRIVNNDSMLSGAKSNMTWDPVSDLRIMKLDRRIRADVAKFINRVESELGVRLRVTDGFRTNAEQNALFEQGRSTPGKVVTNARGGYSYHNYRIAFDVAIMLNRKTLSNSAITRKMADIAKQYNFEWGGDWKHGDKPHFQRTFGKTIGHLQKDGMDNDYEPKSPWTFFGSDMNLVDSLKEDIHSHERLPTYDSDRDEIEVNNNKLR